MQKVSNHTYSIQKFIKRVVITLTALIAVSSTAIFLLVYSPLTVELKKSLIENFDQLAFIRYASLQNNIDRGLEGARSLSSRTMIKNAVIEYENGEMDMGELIAYTQPKYKDGAKALEYLIVAERFVEDTLIANFSSFDYKSRHCIAEDNLPKNSGMSSFLCLSDNHAYFIVMSPVFSGNQIWSYDKLVFDLSDQIHLLCTDKIKSELVYYDKFTELHSDASIVRRIDDSILFYKDDFYYRAFPMQNDAYFITKQSAKSLLNPVYRLRKQTLLAGIGILLAFTAAVYYLIVRYAKDELINLEDSRRILKEAMKEANMDSLTNTCCRRFGEEILASEFENFKKGESSPAILLFDIDYLKRINDEHGHSIGDKVIRSIAEAVQTSIRGGDILLRWGGDEFVGIFGGLCKEKAMIFAQKLLDAVSNITIKTDSGVIRPTISVGISYFREDDISFFESINRADRGMYLSKSRGRNRVHLFRNEDFAVKE